MILGAIGRNARDLAIDLLEQDRNCPASSISLSVKVWATISPVTASRAMCNLRQERGARPCFFRLPLATAEQLQAGAVDN